MRERNPVLEFERQIIEAVRGNFATVVKADTGAGKSTEIGLMLLRAGFGNQGLIGILEPRRIAAISLGQYVSELHGTPLGHTIGYQIKGERAVTDTTRVKFMTVGVLLRELHSDPLLRRYEVVVLDEAHERGTEQDLFLALLPRLHRARPDLKVIIMSATIDASRFAAHLGGAPVIHVPGRMFPVEVKYLPETPYGTKDVVKACVDRVELILLANRRASVLMFLPDEAMIHKIEHMLEEKNFPGVTVWPLYGAQSPDEQKAVLHSNPESRIILATNIAETSLTIAGVTHVVDSGLVKQVSYVSASMSALVVTEHSQAGCTQRTGRAGRQQPGVCYRLYAKDDFENRPAYTEPELKRTVLDQMLLHLRALGYSLSEIKEFEFMDPPGSDRWDEAAKRLHMLGALDVTGNVTDDGRMMERLPVAPVLGRMILAAITFGCGDEIVTIVAGLTGRSVFVRPKGKELDAEFSHVKFKIPTSDALTLLSVWNAWQASGENGKRDAWARANFLSSRALSTIERDRSHILSVLEKLNVAPTSSQDSTLIRKAVAAGLIVNLCINAGKFQYSWQERGDIYIHPGSAVFGDDNPRFMVCSEVVETSKAFARNCTAIDEAWIIDLVPVDLLERTYEIREHYTNPNPKLMETLRWQGIVIREREVETFGEEMHEVIANRLVHEMMSSWETPLNGATHVNRELWREVSSMVSYGDEMTQKLVTILKARIKNATTLAEVLACDVRLRLEDIVTAETLAQHSARSEERLRTLAAEHAAQDRLFAERETERVRNETERAPLRTKLDELAKQVHGIPEAYEIEREIRNAIWSLTCWNASISRIHDAIATIELKMRALGDVHMHLREQSELAWQKTLVRFPACPLCGAPWKDDGERTLRCTEIHDRNRLVPIESPRNKGHIITVKTNRDELVAELVMTETGSITLVFARSRTGLWSGKKFKDLVCTVVCAVLPSELVREREQILKDLAELKVAQAEIEAVALKLKEAMLKVGSGTWRRFTFRIEGGIAVADEKGTRYQAAFVDQYPQRGETWFCRLGRPLPRSTTYTIEVIPEFKVGSVAEASDLEELRTLLRESYQGIPIELLQ